MENNIMPSKEMIKHRDILNNLERRNSAIVDYSFLEYSLWEKVLYLSFL